MSSSTNHSSWYNVILLGCADVGKSSIIRRLDQDNFIHGQGTHSLGKDFIDKKILTQSGVTVTCRIWDTSDMERYSISLPSNLYRSKQGFVFVFSLTSKPSFRNLKVWMDNAKTYYPAGLPPCIILANKSDHVTHSEYNFGDVCEIYRGIKCFETSAADNSGIDEAFKYLATEILRSELSRTVAEPEEPHVGLPFPTVDPPFNFIRIMKTCSLL